MRFRSDRFYPGTPGDKELWMWEEYFLSLSL